MSWSSRILALALGSVLLLGTVFTPSTTFANPPAEQAQINAEQEANADQQVAWRYWHRPDNYYYYNHPGYHYWNRPWR